jgi:hypothetical protein
VTFRNGCFKHAPGLRIRRLPEINSCIVFKPGVPHLYTPNLSAWLLLELCPGKTDIELEAAFVDAVASTIDEHEARQQMQDGVDRLLEQGLIERVSGDATSMTNAINGRST